SSQTSAPEKSASSVTPASCNALLDARARATFFVMAGLVPAIHVYAQARKTWMPGSSPGMTTWMEVRPANASSPNILRCRLFDELLGGFRQKLVGCFAIN